MLKVAPLQILWDAIKSLVANEGLELSSHLAFTILLALFPFLIFLSALAGSMGDVTMGEHLVQFMLQFAPNDIAGTVGRASHEIFATRRDNVLTLSAIFMLWMASNGIEALRVALNRAYRATETRPFWLRRLQGMLFLVTGSFAAILFSFAIILEPLVRTILAEFTKATPVEGVAWQASRYALASSVTFLVLLSIHRWLPNTGRGVRHILPGVSLTVVILLCVANLFSLYLRTASSFSLVYGSLGDIVVTLVFLYLNAITFIFGAEINSAIWRARKAGSRQIKLPGRLT
jgi:membrane protein